jgi:hypothetical protein
MWCHVVQYNDTDVSEESNAFRADDTQGNYQEVAGTLNVIFALLIILSWDNMYLRNVGEVLRTKWRHISEDNIVRSHRSGTSNTIKYIRMYSEGVRINLKLVPLCVTMVTMSTSACSLWKS